VSDALRIALLTAAFALAGVVVGGYISYAENRDLQERMFQREDAREAETVRLAAAAERNRYGQLAATLEVMVQTGRYLEVRDLLRPDLSASDSQLLGSRLNQRQERVKLEADAAIARIDGRLAGLQDDDRVGDLRALLASDRSQALKAMNVVTAFATKPAPRG
jgi:hypothetical protein